MFRLTAYATAAFALAIATVTVAKTISNAADTATPLVVGALTSPASDSSAEPQMTVTGERTILSWLELAGRRTTLKFAERTASGWSEPRVVVAGDNLMKNSADVPAVRALGDGTLVAQWLQENGPDPEAYDLRVSWSKDGGATWSQPTSPHHDGTTTQHGFASLFPAPGGGFGLVWLDGRAEANDENAPMALRATSYGANGVQRRETAVDTRVCECCPTAAAQTSDGVIVAYRNRTADEVRDIYVTRLVGGRWTLPVAVHHDGWKITACPVNGPAVDARSRDVVVAWFTVKKDQGQAYVAFSRDGGRTFAAPIRVDDNASLGRVGVALLADGSAAVTWVEFENPRSQFRVRRIASDGTRSPSTTIAEMSGTRYPRVAVNRNELIFSWTESAGDSSRVRTARAALASQ